MSHLKPKEWGRVRIDRKLNKAGWAVRESPTKGALKADYRLLINGKVVADDPHLIVQAENYTQQALR